MSTWIKFCAQTNVKDALASFAAGANAIGFVFAESKRQVTVVQVKSIIADLPAAGEKIGVFVNEGPSRIAEIVTETGLTGVQMHGEESVDQVRELRGILPMNVTLTKSIRASDLNGCCTHFVDAILIDSGNARQSGGTGQTFDWKQTREAIAELQNRVRVIVAGGLHPENVGNAVQLFRPFGVDVATGIESAPGKKDVSRLHKFVEAVRTAEANGRDDL